MSRAPASQDRWAVSVVDVQNDFCEGGSLAVEGGAAVVERINRWLTEEPARWVARIATADRHPPVLPDHFADDAGPDYVDSWPPHCVAGTPGSELHPNLLAGAAETAVFDELFAKGQGSAAYSGFEGISGDGVPLGDWLRARAVDGIELCGIATDYCVRATGMSALAEGFRVRVVSDLCAGIAEGSVAQALDDLRAAGAEITTVADLRSA